MGVLVIAEAGSTHDGDLGKAKHLVAAAAQAGADVCKFQFWSDPARLAERRQATEYLAIYAHYRLHAVWLPVLAEECDRNGIEFMCTCYLPEDIAVVAPWVKRFKVASFEAQDRAFVQAHFAYNKDVICSTGMSNSDEMHALFDLDPDGRFFLLHCLSAYPAPPEEMNLAVILDGLFDGLSDHTTSVLTGAVAVGAGASILEKHLRLEDTDHANPDFPHSLPPDQFAQYVQNVRFAENLMGDGQKRSMPSEALMMKYRVRP